MWKHLFLGVIGKQASHHDGGSREIRPQTYFPELTDIME
jgi:hypothetical protein